MMFVLRLIGFACLAFVAVAAAAVWDIGWNGGALLSRIAGRDALVQACTPPLRRDLAQKGFAPVDIVFGDASAFGVMSGAFGHRRTLESSFTFTDGDQGPRVDGRMLCRLDGSSVSVDVDVDSLPQRVT